MAYSGTGSIQSCRLPLAGRFRIWNSSRQQRRNWCSYQTHRRLTSALASGAGITSRAVSLSFYSCVEGHEARRVHSLQVGYHGHSAGAVRPVFAGASQVFCCYTLGRVTDIHPISLFLDLGNLTGWHQCSFTVLGRSFRHGRSGPAGLRSGCSITHGCFDDSTLILGFIDCSLRCRESWASVAVCNR